MKRVIFFLLALVVFFLTIPQDALAAKKRSAPVKAGAKTTSSASSGVKAWVRFRPDRLALLIDFSGFGNITSGSYELVYQSEGISQGAGGSIILGDTATKTLLFGTCSHGVCRYHTNITGAKLTITSNLPSGQKVVKTYKIKV